MLRTCMVIGQKIRSIYEKLFVTYGPQGWWPVKSCALKNKAWDEHGYHPGIYSIPTRATERFEIAVGAILTQNTAWKNVQKAINALVQKKLLSPANLVKCDSAELALLIRSSGYYNQKAKKLIVLAELFIKEKWGRAGRLPSREKLLSAWGIGPETADSILLYAFGLDYFVVDAYTRRLLERIGLVEKKSGYAVIQDIFHRNLVHEPPLFNEYHALIVRHAKEHCRSKPLCTGCPLKRMCSQKI